jgi:hypothetical protein
MPAQRHLYQQILAGFASDILTEKKALPRATAIFIGNSHTNIRAGYAKGTEQRRFGS